MIMCVLLCSPVSIHMSQLLSTGRPISSFDIHFLSLRCYFSTQTFGAYITDTALKVSRYLYCFTTFISYGVENYFPKLWGTGISDTIFDKI